MQRGRDPVGEFVDVERPASTGDFVVVVNASKVKLTGRKLDQKTYFKHTGYMGHESHTPARDLLGPRLGEVHEGIGTLVLHNDLVPLRATKEKNAYEKGESHEFILECPYHRFVSGKFRGELGP